MVTFQIPTRLFWSFTVAQSSSQSRYLRKVCISVRVSSLIPTRSFQTFRAQSTDSLWLTVLTTGCRIVATVRLQSGRGNEKMTNQQQANCQFWASRTSKYQGDRKATSHLSQRAAVTMTSLSFPKDKWRQPATLEAGHGAECRPGGLRVAPVLVLRCISTFTSVDIHNGFGFLKLQYNASTGFHMELLLGEGLVCFRFSFLLDSRIWVSGG